MLHELWLGGGGGGLPRGRWRQGSPLCARSMKLEAVRGTRSRKSSTLMSPMLVDSVAVGLVTAREGRMAATANMAICRGREGTVSWAVVPGREEESADERSAWCDAPR